MSGAGGAVTVRPLGRRPPAEGVKRRRRLPVPLAVSGLAILAIAAMLALARLDLVTVAELRTQDLFARLEHRLAPSPPPADLVIVAIDEASMQELGMPWPWPRRLHAELVRSLEKAGAQLVVFDVLFVDPTDEEDDAALAAAIADAGNVVLAEDLEVVDEASHRSEIWVRPHEAFLAAARGSGLAGVVRDPDEFVRRAFLETKGIPALARVVAEQALRARGERVVDGDPVATFGLPAGIDSPVPIRFLGPPRSVRTVSYYQALSPDEFLPRGLLRDKIVLVGRSLAGSVDLAAADHFATPFQPSSRSAMAGVEVHASLVDTLLRRRYRVPVTPALQVGLLALLLAAAGLALGRLRGVLGVLAVLALALLAVAGSFGLYLLSRPVLLVSALVGLGTFTAGERLYRFLLVDRERRFIHKAFRHYVAPAVVEQLMERPEQLNLYGEAYETTVVFTDLVGFTALAERMEPMALRAMLTGYFSEMVEIMLAHRGTLDKFIGDALMCFFGVPVRTPEHPQQAALCAWRMRRRLDALNVEWAKQGLGPLSMRVGVNSGPVVAGNMGTDTLFNFTIMGDCVNLGSRLEGANKFYGTEILVGETTAARLDDSLVLREVDRLRVKGKSQPVLVYELVGPRTELPAGTIERVARYREAFARYSRQEFAAAAELLADGPEGDRPWLLLAERCHGFLAAPPPAEWDGVVTLTSK